MTLTFFQIVLRIFKFVHIQMFQEDVTLSPQDAMESMIARTKAMKPTAVRNHYISYKRRRDSS